MVILVPSSSITLTQRSRKGSLPLTSGSMVKLMWWSMLLIWWGNESTASSCFLTKVSSTYRSHIDGVAGVGKKAVSSKCSIYKLATMKDTGDPMAAPWVCWQNTHHIWNRWYLSSSLTVQSAVLQREPSVLAESHLLPVLLQWMACGTSVRDQGLP